MGPLTQHLVEEHVNILKGLGALKVIEVRLIQKTPFNIDDLLKFTHLFEFFVGHRHHAKEEEILFPAMDASGFVPQGGPHCGLFMGMLIEDNIARKILARQAADEPKHPHSDFILSAVARNSALAIPVEEHDAGFSSLSQIRKAIEEYKKDPEGVRMRLAALVRDYVRLLELHIRKENECLFKLADEIVSESIQADLLKRVKEFDKGLGEQKIASSLAEWNILVSEYKD